jgi:hypothetical protein
MPYDSNLDEKLFSKACEMDTGRLSVSVYSYNNGPKKIQITREDKNPEGNYRFSKLGRLLKEEAEAILPLIQEAIASI